MSSTSPQREQSALTLTLQSAGSPSGSPGIRPGSGALERLEVVVVSPEEADHAVAEFWLAGEQFGQTLLSEGQVILDINPRRDHQPWSVSARDLHEALAQARRLLGGA